MEMIIIIIITMKICKEKKFSKGGGWDQFQGKKYERGEKLAIENWHFMLWKMDFGEKKSGFHLHFETLAIAFLKEKEQG